MARDRCDSGPADLAGPHKGEGQQGPSVGYEILIATGFPCAQRRKSGIRLGISCQRWRACCKGWPSLGRPIVKSREIVVGRSL
jgi:hypothetical protein